MATKNSTISTSRSQARAPPADDAENPFALAELWINCRDHSF
jgi:hypothetical protein